MSTSNFTGLIVFLGLEFVVLFVILTQQSFKITGLQGRAIQQNQEAIRQNERIIELLERLNHNLLLAGEAAKDRR